LLQALLVWQLII
jgi:hypothetical protein